MARLGELLRHFPIAFRRWATGYYMLPSQRRMLASWDWNVLILLDACRVDEFQRVCSSAVRTVRSMAPCTSRWIGEFGRLLEQRSDSPALWFTANPVVNRDCRTYDVQNVRIVSIWRKHWARHGRLSIPGVHPQAVNDEVAEYLGLHGQPRQMIIHYGQPHAPYIGGDGLAVGRWGSAGGDFSRACAELPDPQAAVDSGWITWADLRKAYRANLELVWASVRLLLPVLKGKVVVTSDHSELLGDYGIFGHECTCSLERLRLVPWLEVDRRALTPAPLGEGPRDASRDDKVLTERLRALGYH